MIAAIVRAGVFEGALDHPVTRAIAIVIGSILALTPLVFLLLRALGKTSADLDRELWKRYLSWLVLAPSIAVPILAGRLYTIAAIGLLSLLCYREFARGTGLFRHRLVSAVVVLGILAITFAVADHWYGHFVALPSLTIAAIVVVAVFADQPHGYIQRVALAVFGFVLFGVCLGHLAYLANDRLFRPLLLTIVVCVELNDVFAFICGKLFGKRKLAPRTSPNKTIAGAVGAALLTTGLFAVLGHFVFEGTAIDQPLHLVTIGLLISAAGQFGDLLLSSIKRDLGIKDMAATIPGHGGLLDRFDSLLLVSPVVFHYVAHLVGIGLDQPTRVFTGG